jgi:tellurite methyltransferase
MSEADRLKWNALYRQQGTVAREPSEFLRSLDDVLPRRGRALDVAGGTGRNAIWMAQRGLDVTLADLSDEALAIARVQAAAAGVALTTLQIDLETSAFPAGPWILIVCLDFLWRPLFEAVPRALDPGGILVVSQPTRSNLQRHAKPSSRFLLEDGELPGLVRGLEVVHYEEGWMENQRHEARLVARCGRGAAV